MSEASKGSRLEDFAWMKPEDQSFIQDISDSLDPEKSFTKEERARIEDLEHDLGLVGIDINWNKAVFFYDFLNHVLDSIDIDTRAEIIQGLRESTDQTKSQIEAGEVQPNEVYVAIRMLLREQKDAYSDLIWTFVDSPEAQKDLSEVEARYERELEERMEKAAYEKYKEQFDEAFNNEINRREDNIIKDNPHKEIEENKPRKKDY